MKPILPLFGLGIALAACQPALKATKAEAPATPQSAAPQAAMEAPAGDYTLDPLHSTLVFRLSHIGFSKYVGQFQNFEAALHLDPKAPETSTISVKIDPTSLAVPHPPEGFLDDLRGANWLDAKQFPAITFKSVSVKQAAANTLEITGDLTVRGTTKRITVPASMVFYEEGAGRFKGSFVIDRMAYGVSYDSKLNPIQKDVQVQWDIALNAPKPAN